MLSLDGLIQDQYLHDMDVSSARSIYGTISNFKVDERCIGQGQFSKVYKALCLVNHQWVAIKKVQIFSMMDDKLRHDCLKEIDLLKRLDSPYVIRCLDAFIEDNELHIIMELAEAGDLQVLSYYHLLGCDVSHPTPPAHDQIFQKEPAVIA